MSDPPMREMTIASITEPAHPARSGRVVLLEAVDDGRRLPIWLGVHEGDAINATLAGFEAPRPQTHDLLESMVNTFDGRTERVVVTDLRDDTFVAEITISNGNVTRAVDARPSDAIALAVRSDAPIYVAEAVLELAATSVDGVGGVIEVNGTADGTLRPPGTEDESIRVNEHLMRRFRLDAGDRVVGRISRRPNDTPQLNLVLVESVNGESPRVYRETNDSRLPVVLPTPADWFEVPRPANLGAYGVTYIPFGVTPGTIAMGARSSEVGDVSAREVIDRVISESEGGFELLADDGEFELPTEFEATALPRATREIRNQYQPAQLLEWWFSAEGEITRWVVAVRGGQAIIVVLGALDWEQAKPLEALLSRCELVEPSPDVAGLTTREIEVLRHIVGGATNPEIADRLDISPHTVAKHVKSILAKLEAANRTEAASTALSRGIVDSSSNN